MTSLRARERRNRGSIPCRGERSSCYRKRTDRCHDWPYLVSSWGCFPGTKRPRCKANHSSLSRAKVKNTYIHSHIKLHEVLSGNFVRKKPTLGLCLNSVCAGLCCLNPSRPAWQILHWLQCYHQLWRQYARNSMFFFFLSQEKMWNSWRRGWQRA